MKASFQLQRLHEPVVVLEPDHGTEAILLASWLGYDENSLTVSVERGESGLIQRVTIMASQSR